MLTRKSFAKINITLEIIGKRSDGYHDIASVMQTIDLSDELTFSYADRITLRSNLKSMENNDNLIVKAARALRKLTGYTGGADIFLKKNIPLSSGMGGGSSNAACTLLSLNSLWGLNLGLADLFKIADHIGSDVSFFLTSAPALVKGKGNIVELINGFPRLYVLTVTPSLDMINKTSLLYSYVTADMFTNGDLSRAVANRIGQNLPLDGHDTWNVFAELYNGFSQEVVSYKEKMMDCGAEWTQMTGSGPSLYTFSEDKDFVVKIMSKLVKLGIRCNLSSTISPEISDLI
tara:strand:- start:762 stop:1628 length:867 start_codon:yes stop_codon:yes gene_type:complete